MAKAVNKARLTWIEGLQFVGHAERSGAAMVLDGDPELGGLGSAVRPTEALLFALGGCMAMDVISVLRKKRQKVTAFHVEAQGTRAEEHPRRYEAIALEFVVRGWDISEQAVARAIELSHTKYCSVTASVNAEVSVSYRIEQDGPPA
jgi:putative redox protein